MKSIGWLWQTAKDPRFTNGLVWIIFVSFAMIILLIGHWFPTQQHHEPLMLHWKTLHGAAAEQAANDRLVAQYEMCQTVDDWTVWPCDRFDPRGLEYGVIVGP